MTHHVILRVYAPREIKAIPGKGLRQVRSHEYEQHEYRDLFPALPVQHSIETDMGIFRLSGIAKTNGETTSLYEWVGEKA